MKILQGLLSLMVLSFASKGLAYSSECTRNINSYTSGCFFQKNNGFGKAYLYLHDSQERRLNNLIVYVNGFSSGEESLPDKALSQDILDSLEADKNDILVVDYGTDSTQSIQDSGNALLEVFEHVNSIKKNSLNRSTIIGYSMGGLVAKYALLKAESSGIDHGMSVYVSLDTPHKGAQTPVGLQYLLFATKNQLENLYEDLESNNLLSKVADSELVALENASDVLEISYQGTLDNEASKQMMIFNILDPDQTSKSQLNDSISSMGEMPKMTFNVAVANGTLNTRNTLETNSGLRLNASGSNNYSTVAIDVNEELVDNLMDYAGQYRAQSSNAFNPSVAMVSTRLPVNIEVKGKYFKCSRKKKYGISYPSCGWRYGTIASYTENQHSFNIQYESPLAFDADTWPGSTAETYPEVMAPFVEILDNLDFGSNNLFVNSSSTFIPTLSALNISDFDPMQKVGFTLPRYSHSQVKAQSLFDEVVYSKFNNLEHGDHSLLFREDILEKVTNNRDQYWLIPVITSVI